MLLIPSQVASKNAKDHGQVASKPPRARQKGREARLRKTNERIKDSKGDESDTNSLMSPTLEGLEGARM